VGFKSGFIAILGVPNAGKSTLLNSLVGEKLAIVTPKPQTTQHHIKGILTTEDYQLVFVDTPGIIQAKDKLNLSLVRAATESIEGVDIVYHLIDISTPDLHAEKPILELLSHVGEKTPRFLVINKIDLLDSSSEAPKRIPEYIDKAVYAEIIPVSAQNRENIDRLISISLKYLNEGPLYYDPEQITDREERFIVAEIVREKIFEFTGEEIPYAVATVVDEFRENPEGKHFIRVYIYVERESQKPIILGKSGSLIKKIGECARYEIQAVLEHDVYLELWVKVAKNWRKRDFDLRRFGYHVDSG